MLFKEKFILRVKISDVQEINISSDELIDKLLSISETETVCLLDSCGVGHLDSHLLVAGIKPIEVIELNDADPQKTLAAFNDKISNPNTASIFTISYDFGLKLENIKPGEKKFSTFSEPDIYLANFDCLIIHDYNRKKTFLQGNQQKYSEIKDLLKIKSKSFKNTITQRSKITSNFSKQQYISNIEKIHEYIRRGETYQTNLTQQFRAELTKTLTPQIIFYNLRNSHPAPFASFIKRKNDYVVSISPERFAKVQSSEFRVQSSEKNLPLTLYHLPLISVSPIKGTRPRGNTLEEDVRLKNELINSKKDRAENTMIVDLLRNDLGRICEFGSIKVEKLCDLEEHPSIFHLVSTVSGNLRKEVNFADIIKAIFPCGSITGCPKIRTMKIIDELETVNRGLSMGAIGYCDFENNLDMSVAIRTMVIKENQAIFNVGGGIVIDSDLVDEYEESLLKAKAIMAAIGAE